jgi:hypothetical protein
MACGRVRYWQGANSAPRTQPQPQQEYTDTHVHAYTAHVCRMERLRHLPGVWRTLPVYGLLIGVLRTMVAWAGRVREGLSAWLTCCSGREMQDHASLNASTKSVRYGDTDVNARIHRLRGLSRSRLRRTLATRCSSDVALFSVRRSIFIEPSSSVSSSSASSSSSSSTSSSSCASCSSSSYTSRSSPSLQSASASTTVIPLSVPSTQVKRSPCEESFRVVSYNILAPCYTSPAMYVVRTLTDSPLLCVCVCVCVHVCVFLGYVFISPPHRHRSRL